MHLPIAPLIEDGRRGHRRIRIKLAPRKFLNNVSAFKNGKKADCKEAVEEYNRRLRQAGVLDFDDLIAEALSRKITGKQFKYLHVDEFQDINPASTIWFVCGWAKAGVCLP